MRPVRFSIAGLMGIVLFAAIGFAALRYPTETWAGVVLLGTLAALAIAVVGAFCRPAPERGGWLGFAVFGWIYLVAAFEPFDFWPRLPTHSLLELLAARSRVSANRFPRWGPAWAAWVAWAALAACRAFPSASTMRPKQADLVVRPVADLLAWSLISAPSTFFRLGTVSLPCSRRVWEHSSAGGSSGRQSTSKKAARMPPAVSGAVPRSRWAARTIFVLSGLALLALIASGGAILTPGLWAGATFLLTWWLIGLMSLGAFFARGKHREAWLGATLFGAGFMILIFGRWTFEPNSWPAPPTVEFLNEVRPWLAGLANARRADAGNITAANARIHQTLRQPIPLHFVDETPLEDVLKSIKEGTARADSSGKAIPIYVDPIGLQEAEKTLASVVSNLDFDGVPLGSSLRSCLKQLDLAYSVKDGLLTITSQESNDHSLRASAADAYQVVGHCVFALIAAGLGGLAAPYVCNVARNRTD